MHAACAEAEGQLQSTNEASKAVLERAGNLRDERLVVYPFDYIRLLDPLPLGALSQ